MLIFQENLTLILLLAFFTAISARNLCYGIYLIIILMPFYLWRFLVFGIPSTALEAMIYILFLLWILNNIKNFYCFKLSDTIRERRFSTLSIGIILLFLGVIISTSFSSNLRTSLGMLKGWFFDPFLFFLVFVNVINEKRKIDNVLLSWVLSGAIVALVSFYYLFSDNFTFDGRLKAFFSAPNYLAMYLAPSFLIIFTLLFKNEAIHKFLFSNRPVKIALLGIILIPLYYTFSYGAFLGIFAGVIYFITKKRDFICQISKSKKIYFIVLAISILFFFILLISPKFNQIANSNDRSSFHSRLMIWNASIEMIKESPIIGIGPGTFQEKYLSMAGKFDNPYLEWAVPQPHNVFLAFYLQTGFIGFIGFILIFCWFFRNRNTSIIAKVLMVYILFHGLFDTTYWKNDLSLMFWIIIGLAVVENRLVIVTK